MSKIDPAIEYLVYSIRRDRVGILRNFIINFGGSIGVDSGDDDIILIAPTSEYLAYQLEWSLRHTRGYTEFLSLKAYAGEYNLQEYLVKKFSHTALAYVLGVRMIEVDGRQYTSIPADLPPRVWLELRTKKKRVNELIRRKFIVGYLRKNGEESVRTLTDLLVGYSRSSCHKTIAAMTREGVLKKRGNKVASRVRLAA